MLFSWHTSEIFIGGAVIYKSVMWRKWVHSYCVQNVCMSVSEIHHAIDDHTESIPHRTSNCIDDANHECPFCHLFVCGISQFAGRNVLTEVHTLCVRHNEIC